MHSPYGQVLKAIRENEPRAISLGYDVDRYKLLAFVLSTAIAGLAGSIKTLVLGFATLSDVHWSLSGEVVLMTLLGGLGTFAGPVVGAAIIIGLQNFLADRSGQLGDGDHRRHLRRLRAGLPQGRDRRTAGLAAAAQGRAGLTAAGRRNRKELLSAGIRPKPGEPRAAGAG